MDNIEMEVITNNDNIDMNVISDDDNIQQDVTTETGTKNYNKLYNKPQINNVELVGNKSLEDLGIDQDFVKDDNYVHTDNNYTTTEKNKLSSLHNYDDTEIRASLNNKVDKVEGKGLSTNDYTDAEKTKLASLENYDDTEIKSDITNLQTNKADKSEIPDVSHFITNTVNDLVNYYTKTQTYTKTEVNDLISAVSTMDIRVVEVLPTEDISTTTIYLVPKQTPATQDVYDEYIYVSNAWEHIGSTDIDLSDYVTKSDLNIALSDYTTTSQLTTLLNAKQNTIDSTHKLDSDLVDDTNSGNKFVTTSEKQTWNNKVDTSTLTDYVKFTDYGTTTDAGTVKSGNYGFRISNMGVGYVLRASEGNIDAKSSEYLPIVPAKLDYATKVGITTNSISLSDSEKEKAQNWLGIDEIVADAKGTNIELKDSKAKKVESITLYGKSSQTVNTGSNLTYMTSSNYIVKNAYAKFGTNIIIEDNGSSLYFPTGSVLTSANTRFLVYLLPTTANKWYTFQVEADPETSDIGVTFADYQPNPSSTSDRISALSAGKNISYTFKAEGDRVYCIEFRSPTNSEGVVTNNPTKVKVMFNEGSPKDWEPYTNGVATPTMTTPSPITDITAENISITDGTNTQTATLNLTARGIPVKSGGNYTDENGQEWICDTIDKNTGKYIQRVYRQTLPNSFTKSNASGNFLLAVSNLDYAPKLPSSQYAISYDVMCNQFTNSETWISQNGYVVVDGTKVSFADATEFNTYFAEHPLIYEYVLDTPIETDLTEEQLEELDLATYNGETTITSNAGVEVEYIANAKKYVDNKIETGLMNRDKYVLLAENTITEASNTAVEWESTGEDDVYDDIIVSCENMLGSAAGTGAVAYRLSNSNDNFTVSQSNLLSSSTVRTYWADCIRYLPNKWKFEKRGAANAVGDVTGNAVRVDTQFEDKINRVRFYAGSSVNFVQGTYKIYGRKRF